MAKFININTKRPEFNFLDNKCIGRRCFHPVMLEGVDIIGYPSCSNRKHRGCPDPLPEFDNALALKNKANGWRLSR